MSLLSCDKVSCGGSWLVCWWVLVVWKLAWDSLEHPHSLLGPTDTGHCEADHSPGLQLYYSGTTCTVHTLSLSLSVYLIEGDKTEEDINQMVTWDLSLDVLGRDYLFQFLPGSRQAVGGKNIFLKFPHINLGSTAAKIRTEWNLFIPVKHPISRAQINKVGNLQLFILTERRWLDTIISYWPSRYWHPTT